MSGNGYASRDSVQAPLTLISAFLRLAKSSTFGRSAHGCGGAGGVRGYRMPRWSMMKHVSGRDRSTPCPHPGCPQHNMFTGKSCLTAARAVEARVSRVAGAPRFFC